jgi:hypothetical protein
MKIDYLFYLIFFHLSPMNISDFEVVSKSEIDSLTLSIGVRKMWQNEIQTAFCFELKNGQIGVFPSEGKNGLLFKDNISYLNNTKDGRLPIVNTDNIFERGEAFFKTLPTNAHQYIHELELQLDFQLKYDKVDLTKEYWNALTETILSKRKTMSGEFLHIRLSIYYGEMLKRHKGGSWMFKEEFGINRFRQPFIIDKDNKIHDPWYEMGCFMKFPTDIDIFFGFLYGKDPSVNILEPEEK